MSRSYNYRRQKIKLNGCPVVVALALLLLLLPQAIVLLVTDSFPTALGFSHQGCCTSHHLSTDRRMLNSWRYREGLSLDARKKTTSDAFSPSPPPTDDDDDDNDTSPTDDMDEDGTSLETMLNRARKRPSPVNNPFNQLQAWLDGPVIPARLSFDDSTKASLLLSYISFFTRSDVAFSAIAWGVLNAKGFAIGLLLGRLSLRFGARLLHERIPVSVAIFLVPSWPALCGIIMDQFI